MSSFSNGPKKVVTCKIFENERVVIDGKSFLDCEFKNVTLVYNGSATFELNGCNFEGLSIGSDDLGIQSMLVLLAATGNLKAPIFLIQSQGKGTYISGKI
jgi:hypothetical protein